jgi:hypothetical protein
VVSTWAALSQLQPRWLPHVAERTGSGWIRCGSARSGQACAEGPDWPGAWDPSDPLRPHRRVGQRVKENPYRVLGKASGVHCFAPKARRPEKGLTGGEVWRRLACTGLSVQEET